MDAPVLNRVISKNSGAAKLVVPHWRIVDLERLSHDHALVGALTETARAAGEVARDYFRLGAKTIADVHKKPDGSLVTEADLAVNRFLEERLRELLPEAGWLSEESADLPGRRDQEIVLIVDPIDGTRSFATGNPIWAVSIALVRNHRPIFGVVHAPALGETYVAVKDAGARLNDQSIHVSRREHLDAEAHVGGPFGFAQRLRNAGLEFELTPKIPSLAVRVAKVASGALDAALISANAHDWDVAACDLIITEAGGRLINLRGRQLLYNRVHTMHGELAAGPVALLAELTTAVGLAATP
ncbi:MAG: 3'(2'),5'-bisphosphate nucleotidase CysQ [Pseudomonadota bacterium]